MSNAITKIEIDKDQMALIESQFFPAGASKAEQAYCFSVARELCLNPITREIFFVSRRQKINDKWVTKVEPMVGRDGFLSIAHRTNKFAGIETTAGIRDVPQLDNGKWGITHQLVAECSVWRKDSSKPFTVQVAYNEYCQKTTEGNPTKFWAEKPETMLKKVAESQALRKAFNIHGVYCPEELGAGFELVNGEIVTQAIEADFTRVDTDKTHLTIVKKDAPAPPAKRAKPQPAPPSVPSQPAADDKGLADPPVINHPLVIDEVARHLIDLLDGKHISYEVTINGSDGIISAKSFDEKELLKSSGFRWSTDAKRWIFKFKNEPSAR
ncbi:MAG: phage recombination protein Bet [Proteobacteria bacterium]|nr:phage recombination protein Bet [Pseudomonadota bacterium]